MTEAQVTQAIRLADVFLIGPLMVYAGTREKFSPMVNAALTLTGILTVTYNARRYLQFREE